MSDKKEEIVCVYTGRQSRVADYTVNKKEIPHNWANKVPCNVEYRELKNGRPPTELELEANETFYLLELAKIRVKHYELKLKDIQDKINEGLGIKIEKHIEKKIQKQADVKMKEMDKAVEMKEAIEIAETSVNKIIEERKKKIWG